MCRSENKPYTPPPETETQMKLKETFPRIRIFEKCRVLQMKFTND